jgi:hypothetical protein
MHLDRYDCQVVEGTDSFVFESIGPKGAIKKVVNYQHFDRRIGNIQVVNLAFGDWNEETQNIDDMVVSNNNDRDKVLATVAGTVLTYMEKNVRTAVYATGSTTSKTRLYQMGINAYRSEIEQLFQVFGLKEDEWYPFQHGYNYEAFLILKR